MISDNHATTIHATTCMTSHVDCEMRVLLEFLPTDAAGELPLSDVYARYVILHVPFSREQLKAHGTGMLVPHLQGCQLRILVVLLVLVHLKHDSPPCLVEKLAFELWFLGMSLHVVPKRTCK